MPKRGSTTSGTVAPVPRKKLKNTEPTNGHDDEEQDENIPIEQSSYSTQLFKKSPDVNISIRSNHKILIDYINYFLVT